MPSKQKSKNPQKQSPVEKTTSSPSNGNNNNNAVSAIAESAAKKVEEFHRNSSHHQHQHHHHSKNSSSTTTIPITRTQQQRSIAWWTVMWFICAGLAASLLLAAEIFQDYRPAFPLEPVCATAMILHFVSALIVIRIGIIRWYPDFHIWQPFSGGVTFVSTQIVGYTAWSANVLTTYLYFLAPGIVPEHGVLAAAGIFSAFGNWMLYMSIRYFGASQNKAIKTYSLASNEARFAVIMIVIEIIFTGCAQRFYELSSNSNNNDNDNDIDDGSNNINNNNTNLNATNAFGVLLIVAHLLSALASHFFLGSRHVAEFRWFSPFHGSVREIITQGASWAAFSTALLGFLTMLSSSLSTSSSYLENDENLKSSNNNMNNNGGSGGKIGWGFFGAVGVAANIGLLIQMRLRVRSYFEKTSSSSSSPSSAKYKKQQNIEEDLEIFSPQQQKQIPSATQFLARNTRFVLTLCSMLIALYTVAVSSPFIMTLLSKHTWAEIQQWQLSNRILLYCSISFPTVTHVTGFVLQAYNVQNPFASSLVGTEFVGLQLVGWACFTASILFGVVTKSVIAEVWVAALALLSQILISASVHLIERSSSSSNNNSNNFENKNLNGEEFSNNNFATTTTSSQEQQKQQKQKTFSSPLTKVLAKVQMRDSDELFNGVFITGLVGATLSIILRAGCDLAVYVQHSSSSSSSSTIKNQQQHHQHNPELPLSAVVTSSTILWALCIPLLQFAIGGVTRPLQGPPLYAALQALGWTSYLFILVVLALVSVDLAAADDAMLQDLKRYHAWQFTSQAALMLIPVCLITTSAFFSSKWNEDDDEQNDDQEESESSSSSKKKSDNNQQLSKKKTSPQLKNESQKEKGANTGEEQEENLASTLQNFLNSTQKLNLEELTLLKKLRQQQQQKQSSNLENVIDQMLLIAEKTNSQQQKQQQTQQQISSSKSKNENQVTIILQQNNYNNNNNNNNNNSSNAFTAKNALDKQSGSNIAASIVVVACLAISSLALFVAADHMGRDAPRPVHVTVLGVAALVASTAGSVAAHFIIGPALHGSKVYYRWMPFQGGAQFVGWQATGFGAVGSSCLLFLVDVMRRRNIASSFTTSSTNTSSDLNNNNIPTTTVLPSSALIPTGLLSGIAPILVLCSTFVFDKSKTALDQPGSILYEHAEAALAFVVLGGSWLFTATSELWFCGDWELATIPMLVGSCAALVALPVAVIALRKSAAQARSKRSDEVDNDEAYDYQYSRSQQQQRRKKRMLSTSSFSPSSVSSSSNLMQEGSFGSVTSMSSSRFSNEEDNVSFEDEFQQEQQDQDQDQQQLYEQDPFSFYNALVIAPLALVECVLLLLCAAIPLALFYGMYHIYHNYTGSLPVFVKSHQITVVVVQVLLVSVLWLSGVFKSLTPYVAAFSTYSIPLFLLGFVCSFPAFRPHCFATWWMLVEVVLGIAPPFWIQPVLTFVDCLAISVCSVRALRFASYSSSSSSTTTNTTTASSTTTTSSSAFSQFTLWAFGDTAFLALENAFYFTLLLFYKFRYLHSHEERGTLKSYFAIKLMKKFLTPGLEKYFSLRVLVHGTTSSLKHATSVQNIPKEHQEMLSNVRIKVLKQESPQLKKSSSASNKAAAATTAKTSNKKEKEKERNQDKKEEDQENQEEEEEEEEKSFFEEKIIDTNNDTYYLDWSHSSPDHPDKAIFGYHPHGIFAFTVPWLTNCKSWLTAAGGCLPRNTVAYAANIVFNVPMVRDVGLWIGARAATRSAIVHAITSDVPTTSSSPTNTNANSNSNNSSSNKNKNKNPSSPPSSSSGRTFTSSPAEPPTSALLVPGGQAELIESGTNLKTLRLVGYHLGFLKLAVQNRVAPSPILGFGEHDILGNIRVPKIQHFFLKRLGFPFPIFPMGVGGMSWLPKKVPLTIVVGRAVDLDAVWKQVVRASPSLTEGVDNDVRGGVSPPDDTTSTSSSWPLPHSREEQVLVEAVAKVYYAELRRIFYKFRKDAGYSSMELDIITDRSQLSHK